LLTNQKVVIGWLMAAARNSRCADTGTLVLVGHVEALGLYPKETCHANNFQDILNMLSKQRGKACYK
jgi:hypothetical protein